jgi:hypothetical protein
MLILYEAESWWTSVSFDLLWPYHIMNGNCLNVDFCTLFDGSLHGYS